MMHDVLVWVTCIVGNTERRGRKRSQREKDTIEAGGWGLELSLEVLARHRYPRSLLQSSFLSLGLALPYAIIYSLSFFNFFFASSFNSLFRSTCVLCLCFSVPSFFCQRFNSKPHPLLNPFFLKFSNFPLSFALLTVFFFYLFPLFSLSPSFAFC